MCADILRADAGSESLSQATQATWRRSTGRTAGYGPRVHQVASESRPASNRDVSSETSVPSNPRAMEYSVSVALPFADEFEEPVDGAKAESSVASWAGSRSAVRSGCREGIRVRRYSSS